MVESKMAEKAEKMGGGSAMIRRRVQCLSMLALLISLAISPASAQVDEGGASVSAGSLADQSSLTRVPPTIFNGPAIVIDSKKKQVGLLSDPGSFGGASIILRKFTGGAWVALPISPSVLSWKCVYKMRRPTRGFGRRFWSR